MLVLFYNCDFFFYSTEYFACSIMKRSTITCKTVLYVKLLYVTLSYVELRIQISSVRFFVFKNAFQNKINEQIN